MAAKVTWDEYQQLTAIAAKFGLSVSRYCHNAIMQSVEDHECILAPEHQWPTILNPARIVLVEGERIFRNLLALFSFDTVIFEILVFLQPNDESSEEWGTDTNQRITQLLVIPTNNRINFKT